MKHIQNKEADAKMASNKLIFIEAERTETTTSGVITRPEWVMGAHFIIDVISGASIANNITFSINALAFEDTLEYPLLISEPINGVGVSVFKILAGTVVKSSQFVSDILTPRFNVKVTHATNEPISYKVECIFA